MLAIRGVCFRGLALWKYGSAPPSNPKVGNYYTRRRRRRLTVDVLSARQARDIPQIPPRIRPRCSIHSARHVAFIAASDRSQWDTEKFTATRQWLAIIAFAHRVYVEAKRICSQMYHRKIEIRDRDGGVDYFARRLPNWRPFNVSIPLDSPDSSSYRRDVSEDCAIGETSGLSRLHSRRFIRSH